MVNTAPPPDEGIYLAFSASPRDIPKAFLYLRQHAFHRLSFFNSSECRVQTLEFEGEAFVVDA